jgi:hypothetical protein
MWQAPGKSLGKDALKTSYQHGLDSDMHASASARSSGVCGREKEKIMRGKSEKSAFVGKRVAELYTQAPHIGNDFHVFRQGDLLSPNNS